MAYNGYFALGDSEIINATRTETYLERAGYHWLRPLYANDSLPYVLGQPQGYRTALLDDAPWTDPDIPESYDFFGFYPLDVTGIEDSTRETTVTESTVDGGNVGRVRHRTRPVVFNGVLIAGSEKAMDHGMRWLKRTLLGDACTSPSANRCGGDRLSYFSSPPEIDLAGGEAASVLALIDGGDAGPQIGLPIDGGAAADTVAEVEIDGGTASNTGGILYEDAPPLFFTSSSSFDAASCVVDQLRTLRDFTVGSGPSTSAKRETTDGAFIWSVQFTGVAGKPWEFGYERSIFADFMTAADPWAPGIEGGSLDTAGYAFSDTACPTPVWEPLYDPLCPALAAPPAPPDLALGCFDPPSSWWRRSIDIPKQYIPLWADAVPVLEIHAPSATEVRNLRIRFFPEVDDPEVVPCEYVVDLMVSYIPQGHSLILDAAERRVQVLNPVTGQLRNADTLVMASDGKPFEWPTLSCGYGYTLTCDMPSAGSPPNVDLSLVARAS